MTDQTIDQITRMAVENAQLTTRLALVRNAIALFPETRRTLSVQRLIADIEEALDWTPASGAE